MTFSDALPVHFWLASEETFNEKVVYDVHRKCFCAPWECDDQITLQFSDTAGQSRRLIVLSEDGSYAREFNFSEVASGVYQLSFTPSDNDLCDKQVRFVILGTDQVSIFDNQFNANLDGWTNSGSGQTWAWDATGGG